MKRRHLTGLAGANRVTLQPAPSLMSAALFRGAVSTGRMCITPRRNPVEAGQMFHRKPVADAKTHRGFEQPPYTLR